MTPAQKKTQANFKKAIAYRQKTGCTLKEAFAHVKGGVVKGLDKVVKKRNKTTVLYTKKVAPKKKAAPKKKPLKQGKLFGVTDKKTPVRNYGSHKDTKSHNVKISVMSGINEQALMDLNIVTKKIFDINYQILKLQREKNQSKTAFDKKHFQEYINDLKKYLSELKKHKTELKKLL